MTDIKSSKILIMATHGFEQSELVTPLEKLKEAGAIVHVASLDGKPIRGWNGDDWGDTVDADLRIANVDPANYDALVLPGGQINPDLLRVERDAVNIVRDFANANKIVAAICHGPWLLIEADIMSGREATSYKSIRTDMENAGVAWVDKPVAISNGIITSRDPGDLDAFVAKIIEEVEEGVHSPRAA